MPEITIKEGEQVMLAYEPYTSGSDRPNHERLVLTVEKGQLVARCVNYNQFSCKGNGLGNCHVLYRQTPA